MNAWRSWPHLDELLHRIALWAPHAAIVFLSAPLGILTRCAFAAYPELRWYALCELPFTTLRRLCKRHALDWRSVEFDYAGTNHLGWFDRLSCDLTDLVQTLAHDRGDAFPSGALIRRLGAIPLSYFEMHYDTAAVIARQRNAPARAAVLERCAGNAIGSYATARRDSILKALAQREAPWYYDAVAPFLSWLSGTEVETPFFMMARNRDYLPELHADEVIEIPHTATKAGLNRRRRSRPLSPVLLETLAQFVRFEAVAARAVLERDRRAVVEALQLHPWVRADVVGAIAGKIVDGFSISRHGKER